ncbi:hypothetical protein RYB36_27540, partial [Pseudomonas syringae pv. actinidiae]|nr:hypothetical protein [Pseudomonas syringae pv. actinidiae]
ELAWLAYVHQQHFCFAVPEPGPVDTRDSVRSEFGQQSDIIGRVGQLYKCAVLVLCFVRAGLILNAQAIAQMRYVKP